MESINISFNITPSDSTTFVELRLAQLKNNNSQEEVVQETIVEDQKKESDQSVIGDYQTDSHTQVVESPYSGYTDMDAATHGIN